MVDTWATVGSCAQIGKQRPYLRRRRDRRGARAVAGGTGDHRGRCFVGARSEVAEGVILEQGSVLSMGVFLGASTKIVDRSTGEVHYGRVPAYSVVVPGTLPAKDGGAVAGLRGDRQAR